MQSPNPYHLLKLNSENTESIPENNQETDTVQLPGNITHIEIRLILKILERKDLQ